MVQNERGGALIAVLLVTIMLSLLALSLSLSSMTDLRISSEFENHEKALLIADAGFNDVRKDIHGDLDVLLANTVTVKDYIPGETMRPYDYRNPISLREARNIDFELAPTSGTRNDTGWLTPAEGAEISGGRYFAKVSDNDDG
ncbi:MAG: hypothetical protein EHM61_18380, partial [Acidobacteria bacterium]